MNQAVTAPSNFQPTACPLLTAVLPLRYAIGPRDAIAASDYDIPELKGHFPSLTDPLAPQDFHPLGYTPRLLRDGWLYLWSNNRLAEFQVERASLAETERGGVVVDKRSKPYLILRAGSAAMLAWSPAQWSDRQFEAAKTQETVRERVMRSFTPGAAPFAGPAQKIHEQIGDYMFPDGFKWSCESETRHRPDWPRTLDAMGRCEQQSYVIIDDAWGVLLDLAGLLRARKASFTQRQLEHGEDWAIAGVIRALSDGDDILKQQLPSATRFSELQRAWQEQETEEQTHLADVRRLAEFWAGWMGTLDQRTPGSLDTACGHFDIAQADMRDALETHFALAVLDAASTGPGAKAIIEALDPENSATGKHWLAWVVLGVSREITGNEIKGLLQSVDVLKQEQLLQEAGMVLQYGKETVRAMAFTAAINLGVDSLDALTPAKASDVLFAAVAPIAAGQMGNLQQQITAATKVLWMSILARSAQRMQVMQLTPRQHLERLSEVMGTRNNKSQRRRAKADLEALKKAEAREAAQAGKQPARPATGALATGVRQAIPYLELVPKPAPSHPLPGYGSDVPHPTTAKAPPAPALPPDLPPLRHLPDGVKLPSLSELFEKAPLKSAIALLCAWNLGQSIWGEGGASDNPTGKNRVAAGSALFAVWAAVTAVRHHLADANWSNQVKNAGKHNKEAQALLYEALGRGAMAWIAQSAASAVDVLYFGWEAIDALKAGDLDSAGIYTGLSASSLAMMRVSWQAIQTFRIAQGLALAGDAAVLSRGVAVLPLPLAAQATALTLLIVAGLITLIYTKDSPAEKWVKHTRFGTRPAEWSKTHAESMIAFYQMVMPVSMELQRWREQNPYGDFANEIRLVLLVPMFQQTDYEQGMVIFDGMEEWSISRGMLDFSDNRSCVPLVWGEEDPIPLYKDAGSRVEPQPPGYVRLSRAYHERDGKKLKRITGSLIFQPIEGLYMPPLDIDLS
jgi:hypothetical protein